ncbi:F-box domain-containing protein [Mycena sanguinolenta]|uniref:F-box domain-containing protein n=1 Tax=Mycena sanguinolenta TaxID=230812 RepID=A0A8H7DIR6_9AGAR|nr:F-box domain-containing protein [Mycena sanguinolenta]
MPRLQLLDLPTEILLSILEWVETKTLYQLAFLSRRLNSIALRVCFRRHELDPDSNSVELTLGTRDALSALQISFFIQSLDHIHCCIPHYAFQTSIAPFLRHIKRLETFISRLTFVRRVTLHLASHEGNWRIKLKTVDELCAWSSHVGDLLNCIIKRGCQWLTIVDGSEFEPIHPGLMDRIRHIIPLHSKRIPVMPRFPSGQSQITTLVVNSASFLVSPGINWILAALGQVTSLGLSMASGSPRTWSKVLPRMAAAAPHLTVLNLSNVPDSMVTTILSILDRFSHLTRLHIHSQRRLIPISTLQHAPHLPSPSLRRIETLTAVSELVEHFLSPINPLPNLHALRVGWRVHTDLRLPALLGFLARITPKLNAHPRTPYLNLDIDLCALSTDVDLSLHIPPALVGRQDIAAGRARVMGLTLHLNVTEDADFIYAEGMTQLVALFPQTVLLSLHTGGVTPSESATARLVEALEQTKVTDIVLNGERL